VGGAGAAGPPRWGVGRGRFGCRGSPGSSSKRRSQKPGALDYQLSGDGARCLSQVPPDEARCWSGERRCFGLWPLARWQVAKAITSHIAIANHQINCA
jgi:hypothetical protein